MLRWLPALRSSMTCERCSSQGRPRLLRNTHCGVVLMHMQGAPATMQQAPHYRDVTKDVVQFLAQRVQYAQARGIDIRRIAIDPGFGFGKTDAHNFTLLPSYPNSNVCKFPS